MELLDILNAAGRRKLLFPLARLLLSVVRRLHLCGLTKLAGRRIVSAFAVAPAILQTGSTMDRALRDPHLMLRAVQYLVDKVGLDTACMIADMSLEAEACGCEVSFSIRGVPAVVSHPLSGNRDVSELKLPDPRSDGRLPIFLETVRLIKRTHKMLTIAEVIGPFTLATHLAGEDAYIQTQTDPERLRRTLDYCVQVAVSYARA